MDFQMTFSREWSFIIIGVTIMMCLFPQQVSAQEGYAWILVDRVDFDGSADVADQSRSTIYDASASYAPGKYSITKTYTGDSLKGVENSPEKGETATAFARFENVPDVIYPDWAVNIDMNLGFSDRRIINYRGGAGETSANAFFCLADSSPNSGNGGLPDFRDAEGKNRFVSDDANGFGSFEKRLSAEISAGEKDDRLGLCTRQSFGGITLATTFVYEWLPLRAKFGGVVNPPTERYKVVKDEKGNYIDSGVRVSDIGGEVMVRHGDDPLGWEMLNPGDIIYANDVVWTGGDGECILSLSDMTTFKMKSQSAIILDTQSEKESRLKLLGGRIIANVQKSIETGEFSVEMSQAVAGIKGTIFVCESNDSASQVKVLEGQVEVTSNNGEKEIISPGQLIFSSRGALDSIEEFSVLDELDTWDEDTKKATLADIEERTGMKMENISHDAKNNHVLLYVALLILLVAGIIVFLYNKIK